MTLVDIRYLVLARWHSTAYMRHAVDEFLARIGQRSRMLGWFLLAKSKDLEA